MALRIISHVGIEGLGERLESLGDVQYRYLDPKATVPSDLRGDVLLTSVLEGDHVRRLLNAPHDVGIDWVHVFGTGIDGFDISAVGERELTCSRGATAVPIAEWAMAMLLAEAKQLPGSWCTEPPAQWYFAPLTCLAGQTLALVGLGSIGQAVARRALAFDMRVKALVRRRRPSPVEGVELVENIGELLWDADHIVLAAPATPATHHLLDAAALEQVKPGAHLVNVARASLVDENALRAALEDGRLARASVDVAEPEPLPGGHWFYSHPRLLFSPHISWNNPAVFESMVERFASNVQRRLAGEALQYVVDKSEGY